MFHRKSIAVSIGLMAIMTIAIFNRSVEAQPRRDRNHGSELDCSHANSQLRTRCFSVASDAFGRQDYAASERVFRQILESGTSSDPLTRVGWAFIMRNLGSIRERQDRFAEAIQFYALFCDVAPQLDAHACGLVANHEPVTRPQMLGESGQMLPAHTPNRPPATAPTPPVSTSPSPRSPVVVATSRVTPQVVVTTPRQIRWELRRTTWQRYRPWLFVGAGGAAAIVTAGIAAGYMSDHAQLAAANRGEAIWSSWHTAATGRQTGEQIGMVIGGVVSVTALTIGLVDFATRGPGSERVQVDPPRLSFAVDGRSVFLQGAF